MIGQRGTAVVFVVAAFLLVSMGGAILAAPVTLPLMYLGVRRHPTRPFCTIGGLLSALTVGEVVWAAVYVSAGEPKPWIWVLPVIGAVAVVVAYARLLPNGVAKVAVSSSLVRNPRTRSN
jgi:hypothetical protein